MPTIQFVTKISEDGVISTFDNISKSIEKTADESDKLSAKSTEAAKGMQVSWSQVGAVFAVTGAAIATTGVAVVGALFEMAESTSKIGAAMHDLSARTGISTETLSEFGYAAGQSGASIGDVTTGIRLLATHMEDVTTKGDSANETFKKLGISVTDANGHLRPTSEVLLDVADKFKNMEDGAQKSAIAVELFGRGGLALIPMLNEGRDGIAKLSAEAQRLGIVFGGEASDKADEFDDALFAMNQSVIGLTRAIGEQAYPVFLKMVSGITDVIVATKDWINENPKLATTLLEIAAAMIGGGGVLLAIGGLITVLPKLILAIGTLGTTSVATTAEVGLMGDAIVGTSVKTTAATGILGQFSAGLTLVKTALAGVFTAGNILIGGLVLVAAEVGHLIGLFINWIIEIGGFQKSFDKMVASVLNWNNSVIGTYLTGQDSVIAANKMAADATDKMRASLDKAGISYDVTQLGNSKYVAGLGDQLKATYAGTASHIDFAAAVDKFTKASADSAAMTEKQIAIEKAYRQVLADRYQLQVEAAAKFVAAWLDGFDKAERANDDYIESLQKVQVAHSELAFTGTSAWVTIAQARYQAHLAWEEADQKNLTSTNDLFNKINGLRETDLDKNVEFYESWDKAQKKSADNRIKEENRYSDAFVAAIANLNTRLAESFADMIVHFKFNMDSLINIGQTTASSLLSSFISGFISPFTNSLANLGKSLAETLFGAATGGAGATGTTTGIGGLAGSFGLSGGITGVGSATGTTSLLGLGGSTSLFGGIGLAGASTLGIGAAVAGVVAAIKSQAHWEANTFVKELQEPLINQQNTGVINQLIGDFNARAAAGTLTADEGNSYIGNLKDIVAAFDQAAEKFALGGSDERTVATQGRTTIDSFANVLISDMQKTISGLGQTVQAAAASSGGGTSFGFSGGGVNPILTAGSFGANGTGSNDLWANFNNVVNSFNSKAVSGTLTYYEAMEGMNNLRTLIGDMNDAASEDFGNSLLADMAKITATLNPMSPMPLNGGMDYVPYDNFPALLHKGERVQTAAQARMGGSFSIGTIAVTVNGAASDDPDTFGRKIAAAVSRELKYNGEFRQMIQGRAAV